MSEPKWTKGPWNAFNMVHEETGASMTPEEVGEYVANCMRLRPECDDFLFVSVETPEGERDVCHIGNGPDGPYNAALIRTAPKLYDMLEALLSSYRLLAEDYEYASGAGDIHPVHQERIERVLGVMAEARGES